MLKKIETAQLRPGMFLHKVAGSWLDSPFWRHRILIADPAQVDRLVQAGITHCWIDPERGLDVPEPPPAPGALAATARAASEPAAGTAAEAPPSFDDEARQAARIAHDAKRKMFRIFEQARTARPIDIGECRATVDDIVASLERNASAMLGIARLKNRDDHVFMHSVAVCALMVSLARKLGMNDAQVREAGLAGLLHDVGKAMIPPAILEKPGSLSDTEFAIVKGHARAGRDFLLTNPEIGEVVIDTCLRHHERPDGRGYPDGIHGDALSLQARMAAVCDVYDAITSDRPYKRGWCPAESLVRMSEWAKAGQFDAYVFRAFVECVGVFPVGSLVRLKSERLAVVVEANPAAVRAPRVRVFHSTRSNLPIAVEMLDLSQPGCRDSIVASEPNDQWKFTQLALLTHGDLAPGDRAAPAAAPAPASNALASSRAA